MDRDRLSQREQREASRHPPISGGLSEAVPCAFCGYDLRGLIDTGRCPECGTRVPSRGLQTIARFGAEAWLRRAERGARRWGYSVTSVFLYWIALIAYWGRTGRDVIVAFLLVSFFVSGLAASSGLWGLTAYHPAIDASERLINARRMIRISLAGALLGFLHEMVPQLTYLQLLGSLVPRRIIEPLAWLLAAIGVLGLTWRVARLCRLAGAGTTASWIRFVGTVFVPAWLVIAAHEVLPRPWTLGPLQHLVGLAGMAAVILGLLSLYTPCWLIKHFRAALAELERARTRSAVAAAIGKVDGIPPTTVSGSKEPHGS